MNQEIIVCLPCFNEAKNISLVAEAVLDSVPHAMVMIIDDNSPDGTGNIADKLAFRDSRIFVLHRKEKQGLGKAYLHGFHTILNQLDTQYIVQMDADLYHPPEILPQMLTAIQTSDLVIGSRYIQGGGTKNWNIIRRMVSRFGAMYARIWLKLPVHDPTGGFMVWRKDLLKKFLSFPITSDGYVFQVETTFIAHWLGAHIVEIPICFTDRHVGNSKMTSGIAFEAFWRIPLMHISGCHRAKKTTCHE